MKEFILSHVHSVRVSIDSKLSNMWKYDTAGFKMMATHNTKKNRNHSSCLIHLTVIKPYLCCPFRSHMSVNTPYEPPLSDTDVW